MLRASAETTQTPFDARAITDPSVDPLLPSGVGLIAFVDAILVREEASQERAAIVGELGPAGLVDAAGVVANFEMMNRVADGTGMPVGGGSLARTAEWRHELGLDRFRHD